MSIYVKKVHFKLHESYANPNRIITKPPYEVTETGWGEFEVVIKIYFHDTNERCITLYHILKLFQSPIIEGELNLTTSIDSKKGLVSESYEEIVFQEPTQLMQHYLTNVQTITNGAYKHDTDCGYFFLIFLFFNKFFLIQLRKRRRKHWKISFQLRLKLKLK